MKRPPFFWRFFSSLGPAMTNANQGEIMGVPLEKDFESKLQKTQEQDQTDLVNRFQQINHKQLADVRHELHQMNLPASAIARILGVSKDLLPSNDA